MKIKRVNSNSLRLSLLRLLASGSVGFTLAVQALPPPTIVRHGGGEIRGVRYSNSNEAIRASIGLNARLIEVDLVPSNQGHWYCLHDYEEVFPANSARVRFDRSLQRLMARGPSWAYPGDWAYPSDAEIQEHLKAHDDASGLRHCTLEGLAQIAKSTQGHVSFITDTKYDNYKLLATLATFDRAAFVPQVYNIDEYFRARALGFTRIIYTLYKHGDYAPLRKILKDPPLWKIVLPAPWLCEGAKSPPPIWLNEFEREILVHTVNDPKELCVSPLRVDGYYSDVLAPAPAQAAP